MNSESSSQNARMYVGDNPDPIEVSVSGFNMTMTDLSPFQAAMVDFNHAWRTVATSFSLEFEGHLGGSADSDYVSPDAHSVRFSRMSDEAEAEMVEWDKVLHGK